MRDSHVSGVDSAPGAEGSVGILGLLLSEEGERFFEEGGGKWPFGRYSRLVLGL